MDTVADDPPFGEDPEASAPPDAPVDSMPIPAPKPTRLQAITLVLVAVAGRLTLALVAAAIAMLIFIRLAHEVNEGETFRFDTSILHFFREHQWPPFHAAMTLISYLAGPDFQTAVVVLGFLGFVIARRFWPDGFALLIAGVGGLGVIIGLKALFHRPRPSEVFAHLGYSFPSGHSFFALTVYGMFAYWLARDKPLQRQRLIWSLATGAIFLVGFSRVALGEHYPSDVLAGFAIALPWLWGCLALPTAFHRNGHDLTPEEHQSRVASWMQKASLTVSSLINRLRPAERSA
jgi:undecaprenyl-diphosphatase